MEIIFVESSLPEMTEEFMARIPMHRVMINQLIERGVILMYAVAEDRSKLWLSIRAESLYDAKQIVKKFPIYAFLEPQFSTLMFYNSTDELMPRFSLN